MSEPKRPLKVFLCHAHADRDAVRGLYARLTQDGVDAWLDKEKLLPGQDWEYEIRKAVREADMVVVCLSKQFNQAGFRQKEVRWALDTAMGQPEGDIFIIPARLEECDTLESLRRWHWVDLFEDTGYEWLIQAFRVRADKIGATMQMKKSWSPHIPTLHSTTSQTDINGKIRQEAEPAEYKMELLYPFALNNGISFGVVIRGRSEKRVYFYATYAHKDIDKVIVVKEMTSAFKDKIPIRVGKVRGAFWLAVSMPQRSFYQIILNLNMNLKITFLLFIYLVLSIYIVRLPDSMAVLKKIVAYLLPNK